MTCSATSSEGRRFLVPSAIQMSRSVIIPTTFPLALTAGKAPQPPDQSISVTAARLVVGVQLLGGFLIRSRTIIGASVLLLFSCIQHLRRSVPVDFRADHEGEHWFDPAQDVRGSLNLRRVAVPVHPASTLLLHLGPTRRKSRMRSTVLKGRFVVRNAIVVSVELSVTMGTCTSPTWHFCDHSSRQGHFAIKAKATCCKLITMNPGIFQDFDGAYGVKSCVPHANSRSS